MFLILFMTFPLFVQAQRNEAFRESIHTMQVLVNGEWNRTPLLELGSSDVLHISFDDLTHEYRRYRYRVEHCDFNLQPTTGLFPSDFLRGETSDQPIDDYQESLNTSVLYTHYSFTFPNSRVGVTKSGNYRIVVFDDDEEEDVCIFCFSVVENKMAVSAMATAKTDIDWNKNHQQIKFRVNPSGLRITDPKREIKTVVMQNNRWDNAAINPPADFVTPNEIQWEYAKPLIFKAGNEYRKFEVTNLRVGTLNVDKIRFFEPYYHVVLYAGQNRRNYVYDEDQDGGFYVRTTDFPNSNIQADYVLVHFILEREPLTDGDIYVNGSVTNDNFLPEYKMVYDNESKAYEATLLLKQGYYNYQYLFLPDKGNEGGLTETVEGNYFETENKYTILVYYKPQGGRYDQLVGVREFRYFPNR